MTADPGYVMPNSQTTIAWDNKQPVPRLYLSKCKCC